MTSAERQGHSHSRLLEPMTCTVIGMIGNVLLTVAKLVVGYLTRSSALVADGFHSFSDLAGDVGVVIALRASARPPDRDHPYGHHHYETLGALAASLLLLGTGVLLARKAILEILHHHLSHPAGPALAMAALSIVVKEVMARYTSVAGRLHNSPVLRTNAAHHRSDALSSLAALVGIGGAMAGLPTFDSLAALLIAVWIMGMGWTLLRENTDIIMETRPPDDFVASIHRAALGVEGVVRISGLRVRQRGSVYYADIAVEVPPDISVAAGHDLAHAVEDAVREQVAEVVGAVVHVEPARRATG